ncbi:MAG TPA: methylated-DNA--[protein]-cysteine S-methyltransferase [Candidatus Thermoplasmatota archaeon]|nr:methylated-DNA--[protein]-cysteine S-methyltransferase [Candidatus Thermoplasmatota archaeon]
MSHQQDAARKALANAKTANVGSWRAVDTRFGTFLVAAVDGRVVQSSLPGTAPDQFLAELEARHPRVTFLQGAPDPSLTAACAQLAEYAEGRRRMFELPIHLEGTEFQRRVWHELAKIPYGQTRSYGDIAAAIGRPGASRAVGQANHQNPVAPMIPCHRVITSTGTLGGYGGGMDLKRLLLEHEGAQVSDRK